MSEKIIQQTLRGLGLTEKDTEVYISLAKKGPILARDIRKSFKINKAQVYRSLKNLQSKGIVEATLETPSSFTAMPFEKVFDLYVKLKKDEAQKIEQNRDAALQQWNQLSIRQAPQLPDRFMVIEGRNYIYTKAEEMIKNAKTKVSIAQSSSSLMEVDIDNKLNDFYDNKTATIKVVTEFSQANADYIQEIF